MAPASSTSSGHVVLLGDSIFDNGVYVGGGPAVIEQVRLTLGKQWRVSLLAVDGDVTDDIAGQLDKLPTDATHLVISVGGNDALGKMSLLNERSNASSETFLKLAKVQRSFGERYAQMLDRVMERELPTTVCTIYDPHFDARPTQEMAKAALSVFNDQITREAFRRGLSVIDLRILFTRPDEYANPIEPGVRGGAKIAEQIKELLADDPFSMGRSAIYGG